MSSEQNENDPVDESEGKAEAKAAAADGGKGEGQGKEPEPWWKEITQPFVDLIHAPRALWGINLGYLLEGMVYFGMLGYLAIYFSDFVFQGVDGADEWSHDAVMVLTAGITIAMFFLGTVADKRGVRFALIAAFLCMLGGRALISGAPNILGLQPTRPGVMVGDKVTLRVTEIDTRHDNKTITAATIVSNDAGGHPVAQALAVDLAGGAGTAPGVELESRLVRLSRVTVTGGDGTDWTAQYGSAPVTAALNVRAAAQLGLCKGASFELGSGYVMRRDKEYVIRSHWAEDIRGLDVSACAKPPSPKEPEVSEASLRASTRSAPAGGDVGGERPLTLAELRALPDGEVHGVVRDAYVTYVRNGGYLVQTEQQGPALAVFVSPAWSMLQLVTLLGMLLVVVGYGMYQPAAYAGVRQFTTPKTAGMGFAMLYALMNLGGWLPTFAFLLRDKDYLGLGIPGTFWIYTGCTVLALGSTWLLLSKRTVERATAAAKAEAARAEAAEPKAESYRTASSAAEATKKAPVVLATKIPLHLWGLLVALLGVLFLKFRHPLGTVICGALAAAVVVIALLPKGARGKVVGWLANHPLANAKFFFFIFALIPVQTLFTYNWFVLPQYTSRAFSGWIGEYFEIASNANPLLIFFAVPMIAALTQKTKVYNMMVLGTAVMAAPAFLLAFGPFPATLFGYIVLMTIGEAMWQPRFLQYAAEIAPEGRTGEYMGVAQLPWFLTKMLVPLLYSGWMMDRFCPAEGPKNTQIMWLIFGCIAILSTVLLMAARGWVGKDFKTKA